MSIVEMISKEMVKPSSITPHHLRNHKLSFIDQMAPPVYVPLIFFYQNNEKSNHADESQRLKKSLSVILTQFPPLAGRLNQQNSFIDCNDAGAEFIEAEVHCTRLAQLIQDPQMDMLKQLLPVQPLQTPPDTENSILHVKVTSFDCGGIVVGVCLSHKIADGACLVEFINAWAAMSMSMSRHQVINTDEYPLSYYNLDFVANYFPPIDFAGSGIAPNLGVSEEKITTKRLIFEKEKLAKLKQLVASDVKNPSRVEAVSAFIWRHFIEAATETKTLFVAVHAVNLRPRTKPPIPEQALANCWSASFAYLSKAEESGGLVTKLRTSIRAIDIEKVRNGEYLRSLSKTSVDLFECDAEICNFSSWCRFPMYDVDFGWGKADWVSTTTLPFKNLVILMSTPSGDGIEAWVNVPERHFQMLQTHYNSV